MCNPHHHGDLLVNPAGGSGHTGVDCRDVLLATADAPGDNTRLVPGPVPRLADQGTPPVPLAGVDPSDAPGTHEAGVQLEEDAQPGSTKSVAGRLEIREGVLNVELDISRYNSHILHNNLCIFNFT